MHKCQLAMAPAKRSKKPPTSSQKSKVKSGNANGSGSGGKHNSSGGNSSGSTGNHSSTITNAEDPDYETVLLVMKSMYVMLSLCFPHPS